MSDDTRTYYGGQCDECDHRASDEATVSVTAEQIDAEFLKAREEIQAVSAFQPSSYLVHINDANTVIDRLQKRVMNRFRIEGDPS